MKLKATISTDEEFGQLHKLFTSELGRHHERSTIALNNVGGKASFEITASDTTALRAAVNTVASTLGMYEKTKEATHAKQ